MSDRWGQPLPASPSGGHCGWVHVGACVRTHTQAHTRGVEEGSMRGLGRERERWRQRKREEEEDTRDRSREGRKDQEAEPPEGPGVQPRLPVHFRDVRQVRPPPPSPPPPYSEDR